MKKYTVLWGKGNTITRGISYTFSSLYSKYHIRGKKERVCRGEDPYTQPTQCIQFSLILIAVFLLLYANTPWSPTNSASNTRLRIVGAIQKGKETKHCLEINNSPPTKHFKVKSSQPAVKVFTLDSGRVIKFALPKQADVKGQRTHRIFT